MASEQEVVVKSIEFNGDAVVQAGADSGLTCSKDAVRAVLASDKEARLASGMDGKTLPKKLNKVVLAYSGGLNTSVIVTWLRENYGCEVVCFTADVAKMMRYA